MTKIFLNNKITDSSLGQVNIFDRGFNYGDGLFETIRTVNNEPEFLKEHILRLKKGCKKLKINYKEFNTIESVINKLLKENNLNTGLAYIKIIVTRGIDKDGHGLKAKSTPTIVITAKKVDIKIYDGKAKSIITTASPYYNNFQLKSLSYLPNIMAKAEAQKKKAYEAIFIDEKGLILEGSASNIFILKGKTIHTPPLNGRILDGIIRGQLIKKSKKQNIKVVEANISLKKLLSSDAIFITNSIKGITIINKVDGKKITTSPNNIELINSLSPIPISTI